jgi:hypothetical protein
MLIVLLQYADITKNLIHTHFTLIVLLQYADLTINQFYPDNANRLIAICQNNVNLYTTRSYKKPKHIVIS